MPQTTMVRCRYSPATSTASVPAGWVRPASFSGSASPASTACAEAMTAARPFSSRGGTRRGADDWGSPGPRADAVRQVAASSGEHLRPDPESRNIFSSGASAPGRCRCRDEPAYGRSRHAPTGGVYCTGIIGASRIRAATDLHESSRSEPLNRCAIPGTDRHYILCFEKPPSIRPAFSPELRGNPMTCNAERCDNTCSKMLTMAVRLGFVRRAHDLKAVSGSFGGGVR
jgi:hypothetical protein